RSGGQVHAGTGDHGLPQTGQVHWHLRPGPIGLSGSRQLAAGTGYRKHVAKPGHGGQHLAVSGRRARLGAVEGRVRKMAAASAMTSTLTAINLQRGALLAVFGALAFASASALIKVAAADLPIGMVVFLRTLFGLLALLPWLAGQRHNVDLRSRHPRGHLIRAGFGLAAIY